MLSAGVHSRNSCTIVDEVKTVCGNSSSIMYVRVCACVCGSVRTCVCLNGIYLCTICMYVHTHVCMNLLYLKYPSLVTYM